MGLIVFLFREVVHEHDDVRVLGALDDLQPSAPDVGDSQFDVLVLGLGGELLPCLGGVLGHPDGQGCLQVFAGALSVLPDLFSREGQLEAIVVICLCLLSEDIGVFLLHILVLLRIHRK